MPPPTPFGNLPSGEAVELYTLGNADGFCVQVIPYGATIVSVRAPDRDGQFDDVVLGLPSLADYLAPHPYLGAVAGRVAGRIQGARFSLDGKTFRLAANNEPNHLHGGIVGFSRKLWKVESFASDTLRLSCQSPDGEEGYPGTVSATVAYTVTRDNTIVMETEATTDRATPFSLTQHSYFNLAGRGDILDHDLQIFADSYAPAGDDLGLLGRRDAVSANDLRQSRRLREVIPHLFQEHGDLYFLTASNSPRTAAILSEPHFGRMLTVQTNEDCLQLYTGSFFDGTIEGTNGRTFGKHAGLCLECEGYPDAPNSPALGDITLRPGETFRRTTIYAFSTL